MSGAGWNNSILTLVTFIPAAGALLLLLFPLRDRDLKWFALAISVVTFVVSLHLPTYFDRSAAGFHVVMIPSRVCVMIASCEDSTTAAKRPRSSSACRSS